MTNKQARSTFYVVRVDGDPRDTHAEDTLEGALELAMADEGSTVEWGMVRACDAGEARLMEPEVWALYVPSAEGGAS